MKAQKQNRKIAGWMFLWLLPFLASFATKAQHSEQTSIDSLLKQVAHTSADSARVQLFCQIAFKFPYINPDSGIAYGTRALKLATKLMWPAEIAEASSALGGNYVSKSDHATALKYDYDALKIYEASGDQQHEALLNQYIGIVYRIHGNLPKAKQYDSAALALYELLGDKLGVALMLGNIANVFDDQGLKMQAIRYQDSALAINETLGSRQNEAINLGNIANAYADLGIFSEAMHYYYRGLRTDTLLGDKAATTRDEGNIGETFLEIAKVLDSGKKATYRIVADSIIPASALANLNQAVACLRQAVGRAIALNRPGYIIEYSQSLSEAYSLAHDYSAALNAYKQYIVVRDSMSTLAKDEEFVRNRLAFEYQKREEEIKYQHNLDIQKYYALSALLLLLAGFIFYLYKNQMKANRQISSEKKRSEDLLLNILPAEVAEELKNHGKTEARYFDNVSVMFTDFVGFTKVAEQLSAQELVNELDTCFKAFDQIVEKYKVEKIKTVGDAYLAVSGLPASDPEHAANMAGAAVEIMSFMQERIKVTHNITFQIRIGIHSGSVVAGIVGSKKFAYDIWGDAVNIAARMEQNSEPGKINISETTHALLQNRFKYHYRGEISAKNKGEMKMYFLESHADTSPPPATATPLT